MTDGRVFRDRQIVASESRIVITDDDGQAHVYKPLEIDSAKRAKAAVSQAA